MIETTAELPAARRHNLDLMPTIAALCDEHGVTPADLAEVYVSLGPGSFTGLRIAVATAKMLALSLGVKLVGVPTLDVLRRQHPEAMVCLNVKRDTAWSAGPGHEPAMRSLDEIAALQLPVVADGVEGAAAVDPAVEHVWALGCAAAEAGAYDDPLALRPLYIREPEAVTLWEQRHGGN